MDFKLSDDMDLLVDGGEFVLQDNDETTLTTGFFTDARVDGRRGYWLDLVMSDLWQLEQSRARTDIIGELNEEAKEVGNELVRVGVFARVETNAYRQGDDIVLEVRAFNLNDESPSVDRRFVI